MGNVSIWIRLENVLLATCSIVAYQHSAGSWGLFALLFLAPDLFMLGYLINNRIGAQVYNLVHHYAGPLTLALFTWQSHILLYQLALIWLAHISIDRVFGYGLKYADDFKHTHVQEIDHAA